MTQLRQKPPNPIQQKLGEKIQEQMQNPLTMYRGLYIRIARRLGVDPSYVSRVANGYRHSRVIEQALLEDTRTSPVTLRTGRMRDVIIDSRAWFKQEFLMQVAGAPTLHPIPVTDRDRLAPIWKLVEEMLRLMTMPPAKMAMKRCQIAINHGKGRRGSGYNLMALLEEYNLLRRCIFMLAQKHGTTLNPNYLIQDLAQIGEALDLQKQRAVACYC